MTTMTIPSLTYRDAPAAIDFLQRAFGFERGLVVPGPNGRDVGHAELRLGDAWIMLGSPRDDDFATDPGTTSVYVVVDDVDPVHARAVEAGATIVREPFDTDYGSRDFAARDPEGNAWFFGTYAPGTGG
jgi:uncharacterized glyoxalase superfamily protein PhnB